MHDEANPSFVDQVDQTTLGHRFLMQEFGVAPKSTWQVRSSPAPHVSTHPNLAAAGPIHGVLQWGSRVVYARTALPAFNGQDPYPTAPDPRQLTLPSLSRVLVFM